MTDLDMRTTGFLRLVDTLEQARSGLPSTIPAPIDEAFAQVARAYRRSPDNVRREVRDQLTSEYYLPLLALGDRAAEWAAASGDPSHLEDAATAQSLEDNRFDPRENIIHSAVLWHFAKVAGVDPRALFLAATAHASDRTAEAFREFVQRPEDGRSLRSMGLESFQEDGRARVRQRKPPWLPE